MKKTRFKFLRTGLKSENGRRVDWKMNTWRSEKKIEMCERGFHCSKTPSQAMSYVRGEILAKVEVRGKGQTTEDKECYPEMRIIQAWNWTKDDSVALAIYATELVINIFEKKNRKDEKPRKAIEAAKNYLKAVKTCKTPDSAADDAERSSNVARSAQASFAALSAAYAARSASNAADDSPSAAAYAACRAISAAACAAYSSVAYDRSSVAQQKLIKKIDTWFLKRIPKLTKYEQ